MDFFLCLSFTFKKIDMTWIPKQKSTCNPEPKEKINISAKSLRKEGHALCLQRSAWYYQVSAFRPRQDCWRPTIVKKAENWTVVCVKSASNMNKDTKKQFLSILMDWHSKQRWLGNWLNLSDGKWLLIWLTPQTWAQLITTFGIDRAHTFGAIFLFFHICKMLDQWLI